MSVSGLPLESFALLRRSIVPPVTYSTWAPVSAVNFLPTVSATMSRQLPPQMLTDSFCCASAGPAVKARPSASVTPNPVFVMSWTSSVIRRGKARR
jgi:hypothetical protein